MLIAKVFHFGSEVECNEYCRKVLLQRQAENLLPACKVHNDVCTLKGPDVQNSGAEGVGGGFPCQAGPRVGVLGCLMFLRGSEVFSSIQFICAGRV